MLRTACNIQNIHKLYVVQCEVSNVRLQSFSTSVDGWCLCFWYWCVFHFMTWFVPEERLAIALMILVILNLSLSKFVGGRYEPTFIRMSCELKLQYIISSKTSDNYYLCALTMPCHFKWYSVKMVCTLLTSAKCIRK